MFNKEQEETHFDDLNTEIEKLWKKHSKLDPKYAFYNMIFALSDQAWPDLSITQIEGLMEAAIHTLRNDITVNRGLEI